jgi:hypothetical protein
MMGSRGRGLQLAGLAFLLLFAVAPFRGTAGAGPLEQDLQELSERLRDFRIRVADGQLSFEGVRQEAIRILELKRAFILSAYRDAGVLLEPYLDLARIHDQLREAGSRGPPERGHGKEKQECEPRELQPAAT